MVFGAMAIIFFCWNQRNKIYLFCVNISVGSMVYSKVRKTKRAHLKWNVTVSVAEAGPLIPARTVPKLIVVSDF
jgi:hypothetical protein